MQLSSAVKSKVMVLLNMEKCYNYFNCKKTECVMFQNKGEQSCWETEGTLCFFPPFKSIIEETNQKEKCNFCLYKIHRLQQA